MSNDNAKTTFSNSLKAEVAATNFCKPNQGHDAAARSRSISRMIVTTLAEWHRADHTARRSEVVAAATRSPAVQRDGHIYAPATSSRSAAAFDATHVTLADQVNPRRYHFKQSHDGNFLSSSANHRITRCSVRINA